MRTLLACILASVGIATLLAQRPGQPGSPGLLRIEPHRLGKIAIGASAEDVYEAFARAERRLVDLEHEGHLSPALELTLPGATKKFSVVAELGCRQGLVVSRIFIRDPAFRTAEGIGAGSTVAELRKAYTLGDFSTAEGGASVVVNALSATFELDQTGSDFSRVRSSSDLPGSTKIVGVLLWR
jgi:hypothetical protein